MALTWAVLLKVCGVLGVVDADLAQDGSVDPPPEPGLVLRHVQPAHELADAGVAGLQLAQALHLDIRQPPLRLCNIYYIAIAIAIVLIVVINGSVVVISK